MVTYKVEIGVLNKTCNNASFFGNLATHKLPHTRVWRKRLLTFGFQFWRIDLIESFSVTLKELFLFLFQNFLKCPVQRPVKDSINLAAGVIIFFLVLVK